MREVIHVIHYGDLYDLVVDETGRIVWATVAWDNCSRRPEVLELTSIPNEVIEKAINQQVKKHKHGIN